MGYHRCDTCNGCGLVTKPDAKSWEFFCWKWRKTICAACGGDGYAKPPGWPDREEMKRLRPAAPPPPPPRKPAIVRIVEGRVADRHAHIRQKVMYEALEKVLAWLTNANAYETGEIAAEVMQALRLNGYCQDALDDAAIAMMKGAAHQ